MKTNKNISAIAIMKKKQSIDKERRSQTHQSIDNHFDYRAPCHVYQ